jgi:hypothetical protein
MDWTQKNYGFIVKGINGVVSPSKYGPEAGRLKLCACGVPTNDNKCGVCYAEDRAGISLRVHKR